MSGLRFFPIAYEVSGQTVILAGGGEPALNKLRLLLRSKATVRVIAPELEPDVAALVDAHGLHHVARELAPCDLFGAVLLFAGAGDEETDARYSRMARAAGVPVNVVDRPHLSDFAIPAIVDRAPIAVAISSDGLAPVLAQRVRAQIEQMLAPEFGRLGELARAIRETVMQRLDTPLLRRRFWSRLFEGRLADQALAGDIDGAAAAAIAQLDTEEPDHQGVVWLIGAGPGSADLLTIRAQRLLQTCDVVVHDQLVPREVIDMARRDAERICVGKAKGDHSVQQAEIDALIVRLAREGKRVARLKSGDPMIFGRVGEELKALREAGVPYQIVPGITAALAAAADARAPLTLRGVASSLAFATAHGADNAEPTGWTEVARSGGTLAVYMGKSAGRLILDKLTEAGIAADTPVIAVENAGRSNNRVFSGIVSDLPALSEREDLAGPVLILAGPAMAAADLEIAELIAPLLAAAA
jgi:uroporphyrin-III C-methyltransferase/precorrin-2 dehydrogenase/sirohydrochlorin ferrochelatase